MKIAVLVKQVPGSESSLPINGSNDWVDESSITYVMNPPDNFALEEALIIKEKIGSGEVNNFLMIEKNGFFWFTKTND